MATFYLDLDNGNDTGVVDMSPSRKMATVHGTVSLSTSQSKWGTASIDFSANNSGKGVSLPDSADWAFGSGQFTVEAWVRFTIAQTDSCIAAQWSIGATDQAWALYIASGSLYFRFWDGASLRDTSAAWTPTINTWYHIAADRDGSNAVRIYIDGSVLATQTFGQTINNSSSVLEIGTVTGFAGTYDLRGYVNDVRITKGVARYAGAFTPPAAELPHTVGGDGSYNNVTLLINASSAAGAAFNTRFKTITSGPTAGRIAPGDTIRLMASPSPTLVGNVTWTNASKTLTLPGAVTANVNRCETSWTASANVTTSTTATCKEGSNAATFAFAGGFSTGKVAYQAVDGGGTVDFSGYQQLSFWFQNNGGFTAGSIQVCLCSDATGDVVVDTFVVPSTLTTSQWSCYTVDKGSALGNAIQTVAIYTTADPGTITIQFDNIIACKAVSSADSLTLNSLIGKVHNLYWAASTSYAQNDKRKPTPTYRNGFVYKVQNGGGGTTGGSEPTWPAAIGETVVDGGVTWVCEELEDTWHAIQSINGTTVLLDAEPSATAVQGRGYYGATETVATYKFQPTPINAAGVVQDSGTINNPITFVGGWDRDEMATQVFETWTDVRSPAINAWEVTSRDYITLNGLGSVRAAHGFYTSINVGVALNNCHAVSGLGRGFHCALGSKLYFLNGCHFGSHLDNGFGASAVQISAKVFAVSCHSSRSTSGFSHPNGASYQVDYRHCSAKNNAIYGFEYPGMGTPQRLRNCITSGNASGGIGASVTPLTLSDCLISEGTEFAAQATQLGLTVFSHNHDQTAGNHKIFTDGGAIVAATDQRHTGSGYSWKFNPTSTNRNVIYPLELSVVKIACAASTAVTVKIWTRRDNTDIKGQLLLRGGQVPGIPADVTVACEPAINNWVESNGLTFTPTANGVVEIMFLVWDGVGTTNSYWVDDLSLS